MSDEDVAVAPDAPVDGVVEGTAPEQTDAGGETSSGAWPAEAQAEYTRKTQALADERKQWDAQRDKQTQQLQQYAQQMQQQQYAQQAQQQAQQGQQSQQTMLDQLRQMPYLDGATAAQLMERMVNEGINPLNKAIQNRDVALAQLHKQYKALQSNVGETRGAQAQKDLDSRFMKIREEQGLPDAEVIKEVMQDIYLSHEGDSLDSEFPAMMRNRWEAIQKAVRDSDRAAAKKAKNSPFPSRGGEVSPTSGKTGGYKTPEERTNELWPMLNPGQSE
jgi:uncharacterized phage infection (PIP) family protein YhgE